MYPVSNIPFTDNYGFKHFVEPRIYEKSFLWFLYRDLNPSHTFTMTIHWKESTISETDSFRH